MAISNRVKYLLKNTGILGLCMFSSKIMVFLLVPIYTSVLSTSAYGTYDLAVTTMHLLYPVLTINIAEAVMRFLMDKDSEKRAVIGFSIRIISAAIFVMGILIACNSIFCLWTDINGLEVYIFCYFVAYILHNWLIQTAKGLEEIKCMGFAGLMGTVTMLLLNIILLLYFKSGLKGFFVANTLGEFIPALYIAIHIRVWKYFRFKQNKDLQLQMLKYCAPMILVAIGWWANSSTNKYVVAWICGASANGLFSVAYKIPTILTTVQQIFIQAWQVSAVKEYDSKESSKFYKSVFIHSNALMCIACSIIIIFNRLLASFLFANEFYNAWSFVPFLLVSSMLNAASGYIGAILLAQKNVKSITLSAVIGICANALVGIVLVFAIGVQGAAIAVVVSSFIIFFIRMKSLGMWLFEGEGRAIPISWFVLIASACFEIYTGYYVLTIACALLICFIYGRQIVALWNNLLSMITNRK